MAASAAGVPIDEVPQQHFTQEEMETTVRVLSKLRQFDDWVDNPRYKPLRTAGLVFIDKLQFKYFKGEKPENYRDVLSSKQRKGLRRARLRQQRQLEAEQVNKTAMRAHRIEALSSLTLPTAPLLTAPASVFLEQQQADEASAAASAIPVRSGPIRELADMEVEPGDSGVQHAGGSAAATAATATSAAEVATTTAAEAAATQEAAPADGETTPRHNTVEVDSDGEQYLQFMRQCYMCKSRFNKLHFFYDKMCPSCAELSWQKRQQTADLTDKVALVTGGRIKIGYLIVLRLLRCGATVLMTTRFPNDAAKRFAKEADYETLRPRLRIYGLDFRDIGAVERFCDYVVGAYERLDVIINNAAQTVRRPPAFYEHLIQGESAPLPLDIAPTVASFDSHAAKHASKRRAIAITGSSDAAPVLLEETSFFGTASAGASEMASVTCSATAVDVSHDTGAVGSQSQGTPIVHEAMDQPSASSAPPAAAAASAVAARDGAGSSIVTSAMLSQVPLVPGDEKRDTREFPPGMYDGNSQQLDLRLQNSWKMRLHEVSTVEMVECHAVNAVAPFVLNARLKPLMMRTLGNKYIVNVSAMEGKFYRFKSVYHPHTNMAKAALNMLTRTSAPDYAKDRIFMTAVDTGWVTDENPYFTAQQIAQDHNFQCPIDETDAMARVLDPVFLGYNQNVNLFGKFLKDYQETEW